MSEYRNVHELMTEEGKSFANTILTAWKTVQHKDAESSAAVRFVKFHVATAKTLFQIALNPVQSMRFALSMFSFVLMHTEPEQMEQFKEITPADLNTARAEVKKDKEKPTIVKP